MSQTGSFFSPQNGTHDTCVRESFLRPKRMSSTASQHNHQPSPASQARSRQPRCGAWRTWRPGADASAKPCCAQCCFLSGIGGGDGEKTHSTRTRNTWRGAQPLSMHRAAISGTDTQHGWRGAETSDRAGASELGRASSGERARASAGERASSVELGRTSERARAISFELGRAIELGRASEFGRARASELASDRVRASSVELGRASERSRQPRSGAWRAWRPGTDASAKPSCAQCCVLSEVGGGDDEKTHSTRTRNNWRKGLNL